MTRPQPHPFLAQCGGEKSGAGGDEKLKINFMWPVLPPESVPDTDLANNKVLSGKPNRCKTYQSRNLALDGQ